MRIAAIDIGSNSLHMIIAQIDADGRFHILDRAKEMVQLGRRTLSDGRLSRDAMRAAEEALTSFRKLAERQGVTRFRAVATSAVREAANGGDLVRLIDTKLRIRVSVIPGREEGRLVYLAVRHAIDLRGGPCLIADLGGGSLELVLVENGEIAHIESVKLGVARLCEQYIKQDPIASDDLQAMRGVIRSELAATLGKARERGVRRVIGTSGTFLNLIALAGIRRGEPPGSRLNHFTVAASEVRELRRHLQRASRSERLRMEGLDAKRVDQIVAGSVIADHILDGSGATEMVACTWALREGLLLDFIARHRSGIEETERYLDPRRRSVARLARHLGETTAHGAHVAKLALELFDQVGERLGSKPEAREWLEYAAQLHDIGHHIAHHDHHLHSHYLILHGELLGFRREEIELVAQVARYHRKGAPKMSDPELGNLSLETRRTIRALAALLRVADGLDRSHYGVVKHVRVRPRASSLRLLLDTEGEDAQLEVWEAKRRARLLEKLLDTSVEIRVDTRPASRDTASPEQNTA